MHAHHRSRDSLADRMTPIDTPSAQGAGSTDLEPAPRHRLPAIVRALRPKQWVKNVLVFSAPLAAGQLLHWGVLRSTLGALVAFALVSSAVYLQNDARDVEEDRQHPRKRFRPIAAGELSIPAALVMCGVVFVAGAALGFWINPALAAVLVVYAVMQVGYTAALKHQPVLDLAIVALGFLLRAIAGGVASGIPLSQWFLLVASFGSLFMVAGKRYSEIVQLGAEAGTRPSLASYTPGYLRFVWTAAAVLVIAFYSLWAFDQRHLGVWGVPWTWVSIAPFTLAILSYARQIDSGEAGEPESAIHDPVLLVLGALWLVTTGIAVFGKALAS